MQAIDTISRTPTKMGTYRTYQDSKFFAIFLVKFKCYTKPLYFHDFFSLNIFCIFRVLQSATPKSESESGSANRKKNSEWELKWQSEKSGSAGDEWHSSNFRKLLMRIRRGTSYPTSDMTSEVVRGQKFFYQVGMCVV